VAHPEPEKGGRGKLSQIWEGLGESRKTAQNRLSEARTVLREAPDLAQLVVAGKPLDEAYTETRRRGSAANVEAKHPPLNAGFIFIARILFLYHRRHDVLAKTAALRYRYG
jgi:hypothetical protein